MRCARTHRGRRRGSVFQTASASPRRPRSCARDWQRNPSSVLFRRLLRRVLCHAAESVRPPRQPLLTAHSGADFFRLPHPGLQAAIIFGMALYEVTCFQPELFPFYGVPGFGPFIQYLVNDHMVRLDRRNCDMHLIAHRRLCFRGDSSQRAEYTSSRPTSHTE